MQLTPKNHPSPSCAARFNPRKRRRIVRTIQAVILTGAVLLGGGPPIHAQESSAGRTPDPEFYELSPRDQIELSVYGEPDLTDEQRIDGRGQVRVPLIGTTRLAGMTVRQAEEFLARAYVEQRLLREPMVTIQVVDYAPKEVAVLGAVEAPGKLTFPIEANSLDIVDVISQMGGFKGIAKSDKVRVTRIEANGGKKEFTVNVERMITGRGRKKSEEKVEIYPGDILWVPERLF